MFGNRSGHFVASEKNLLTMQIMGCEIASVSASVSHVDQSLPPPDNLSALM